MPAHTFARLPVHALITALKKNFWKKEVKLGKNQKKAVAGINCGPWPIFPNITYLTHFYIWGVKCSGHIFLKLFLGKTGQITRYLEKKIYGHQLGPMTHFLTTPKFELLPYIYIINFLNLPVRALIHDLQKKNLRASTRTHDPFFDNPKFDLLLYIGEKCLRTHLQSFLCTP